MTQGSETVQFGYDAANRRTSLILPNAVSMVYGYDAANQLTGINYVSPTNTAMGSLTYGYDLDGRRISKTGSFATDVVPATTSTPGTFDLNNRQTSFNGTTPSYDANGNLTSNGVDSFVWNARNQLTQITEGGTTKFSYAYDALGRRTSKSVVGATAPTTYLYDGSNAVQEAIGNVTNPILTGLGTDERFARNDVNGRTDLLTDALNSTIALTDLTGTITQQYSYDPYGNVTQSDTTTGFTNPYLYTGREADSAGLYYYRARYYSPTMGRFISEDPMGFGGGQNNFYAYVGNNPLSFADPYGLWAISIGINGSLGAMWGVTGGFGFTFDSSGNVATYSYGGEGFAAPGGSFGVNTSFLGSLGDDTTTIDNLAGPFGNASAGYGVLTADGFYDPTNKDHVGGGFTFGPGASFFVGCTNTTVNKIGNIKNFDDYILKKIFGLGAAGHLLHPNFSPDEN